MNAKKYFLVIAVCSLLITAGSNNNMSELTTKPRYFYTFPINNTSNGVTSITLKAKYKNTANYLPFVINNSMNDLFSNGYSKYTESIYTYKPDVATKQINRSYGDSETSIDPANLQIMQLIEIWTNASFRKVV